MGIQLESQLLRNPSQEDSKVYGTEECYLRVKSKDGGWSLQCPAGLVRWGNGGMKKGKTPK